MAIDPHVHCRDGTQSYKETIAHALSVAERVGLSGIFDMPNTSPPITSKKLIEERLALAEAARSQVFYGLYAGLTSNPAQIREVVRAWREHFPRVVGLKMFAGHSVGDLGIIRGEAQAVIYQTLAECGFGGVLAVHCEKEGALSPEVWNPASPRSHSYARPLEAEVASVREQIALARRYQFKGNLHVAHVSVPASVELIEEARQEGEIRVSCGLTPHHCLLSLACVPDSQSGLIFKVNPPLRAEGYRAKMMQLLGEGKIDWIETDHAPHTLKEKLEPPHMSGFPGLPFYPHFIEALRDKGFTEGQITSLTHDNICRVFGMNLPNRNKTPDRRLHMEYEVDAYRAERTRD